MNSKDDDRFDAEFEEALKGAFRDRASSARPTVPPRVDAFVRSLIETKSDQIRHTLRRRRTYRILAPAAAAAAILLLGLSVLWLSRNVGRDATPTNGVAGGSGTGTDIVDAYLLARRIKLNAPLSSVDDHNGDGRVTQDDADALARQAVSLSKRGTPGA